MASVLKVDQIQLPDGSAPTASDLGVDVSGSVVGMHRHKWFDQTAWTTSVSFTTVTNSTTTYVPKLTNSKLIILTDLACRVNGDTNGFRQKVYVDGVNVSSGQTASHELYVGFNGTDFYARQSLTAEYDNTTGNAVNVDVRVRNHGTGGANTINFGSNFESAILVYEIAQ